MNDSILIDYAASLMEVERLAKGVHHACLERDYEKAQEQAMAMGVEARLTLQTLRHMHEKEKAR